MKIVKLIIVLVVIYILIENRLKKIYASSKEEDIELFTKHLNNGDIIFTCKTNNNSFDEYLPSIRGIDFRHTLIVLEIKGVKYFLHVVNKNYKPEGYYVLNNQYIQLIECNKYFNGYQKFKPVYKIIRCSKDKHKLSWRKIKRKIRHFKHHNFCYVRTVYDYNYFTCCTFQSKLLNMLGILNESNIYFPHNLENKLNQHYHIEEYTYKLISSKLKKEESTIS